MILEIHPEIHPRRSAQLAAGLASALIADHSRYNLVKNTQFYTAYFPAVKRRSGGSGECPQLRHCEPIPENRYRYRYIGDKTDT